MGHVVGAFTGASKAREGVFKRAEGGTVFLDEIDSLPTETQALLLRVLQEKRVHPLGSDQEDPVDFRLLTATNKDLVAEVDKGRFRVDLYYRMAGVSIEIPPLRERKVDIQELADVFIRRKSSQKFSWASVTSEAQKALLADPLRGNVRQLEALVEKACVVCRDKKEITLGALALDRRWPEAGRANAESDLRSDCEKGHVTRVFGKYRGNIAESARRLGISQTTLRKKLKDYGLR
jgi:DNA-binding NtrC family response regulator